MEENRIEVDEDEICGWDYGESITLTINEIKEDGTVVFKIIPADTIYVKFNSEEGCITLCSTLPLDLDADEEEVIAEIRMPAKIFEEFIQDVKNFIHERKLKQTKLENFMGVSNS